MVLAKKHAPGTSRADNTKLSVATLPYELQTAVFEAAAMVPQVVFMDITNNILTFSRPANKGLGLACRLSRELYVKSKELHKFGDQHHWIDPKNDIFYLRKDDPLLRAHRPNYEDSPRLPEGDQFDRRVIENVAVDLQYLGEHPRYDAIIRIWTIFPFMKTMHIFIPNGPPQTPSLASTPETLELSKVPGTQVVAAPGHDKELWFAVRYQVKKVCARILSAENGWQGRVPLDVVGHLTSLNATQPEITGP